MERATELPDPPAAEETDAAEEDPMDAEEVGLAADADAVAPVAETAPLPPRAPLPLPGSMMLLAMAPMRTYRTWESERSETEFSGRRGRACGSWRAGEPAHRDGHHHGPATSSQAHKTSAPLL